MAYQKNKGGYTGGRKGGSQKKEYDPTIVSAKDVMMAHMNAVTAVYTLAAAQTQTPQGLTIDIEAEVERVFQANLAVANNDRVGPAAKAPAPAATPEVAKAAENVADAFGEEDDAPAGDGEEIPYANLVINKGKHAGNTLADIYEEDESYVTEFLVSAEKNKNTFTRKAAQAFLNAVA